MKHAWLTFLFFFIAGANTALAEDDLSFYAAIEPFVLEVEDPITDTDAALGVGIAFGARWELGRVSAVRTQVGYLQFDLDAGFNEVGQEVSGWYLEALYQHAFPVSVHYTPNLEFGIQSFTGDYENRATATSDGFLDEVYENRDGTEVQLMFGGSVDVSAIEFAKIRFSGHYLTPLGDGLSGWKFGLGVALGLDR